MSIGLSLLSDNGKKVINITDQKVNFGGFAADNLALKDLPLYKDIYALFAGNDVAHVEPILDRAREILLSSKSLPSVRDAAYALDQAYGERLHDEIYRRVLRKRGFDVASFREKGKQKCTPSAYLSKMDAKVGPGAGDRRGLDFGWRAGLLWRGGGVELSY